MRSERIARLLVAVGVALPLAGLALALAPSLGRSGQVIAMHAQVAEEGGWMPDDVVVQVGTPVTFRLTSDDVVHGFGLGRSDVPAIDVLPGRYSELTLTFDHPGRYTYYCTRWCGAGHWRMRGTIEARGAGATEAAGAEPLYMQLGLDLDAPHLAPAVPGQRPSAAEGDALGFVLPAALSSRAYVEAHSPFDAFQRLRAESSLSGLQDDQVWDLVAMLWRRSTTPQMIEAGRELFAQNCAACHGEDGRGDGVMASFVPGADEGAAPADFTSLESMMGASPALLQGKILRGGMGTGMPYFGPIFTDQQLWSLVDYLWTFTMEVEE